MIVLAGFMVLLAARYAWRWRTLSGRDTPFPRKL